MAITKEDGVKVLDVASIAGNSSTSLSDNLLAIELSIDTTLTFTAIINFDSSATEDVRVHIRSSYDGEL